MKDELLKLIKDNPGLNRTELAQLYAGGYKNEKYLQAVQMLNKLRVEV